MLIKKSVSDVLKGFEKTINDLRAVAEKNEGENLGHEKKVSELNMKIAENNAEISKAKAVADRLESLLG